MSKLRNDFSFIPNHGQRPGQHREPGRVHALHPRVLELRIPELEHAHPIGEPITTEHSCYERRRMGSFQETNGGSEGQ